jgi:hypothetical protein
MRRTGGLIELPLKAVIGAAGWAREKLSGEPPPPKSAEQAARKLEENLMTAATTLHQQLLSPQIAYPLFRRASGAAAGESSGAPEAVAMHPALWPAQERLGQRDIQAILQSVVARQEEIGDLGADMQRELRGLADHFRSRMGLWDKVGQTFWAFLNVLPAAAAVTYVLSTGDPVGAAAIKVKLAGLFGLKDLYALVAIPVTRGMKQADQRQLKAMLGPVAQSWLSHKFKRVQALFEEEISGDMLRAAAQTADAAEAMIAAVSGSLARAREGAER